MDELEHKTADAFDLRNMTEARVLLGRFGAGLPTQAALSFLLDHARARQAVWSEVDWATLREGLIDLKLDIVEVESQATDRATYVRRPDMGRKLSPAAVDRLTGLRSDFDVAIVIADGLSASAIDINAIPLVRAVVERVRARHLSLAPLVLASRARVALGDPITEALGARLCIMVIGERPGLSAADSAGIYITFAPRSGTPDSRRNCISNIRDGGLGIEAASDGVMSLIMDMLRTGISGVGLKDALASLPGR